MIEEREVWMVLPTGGLPSYRKAHFIKPILSSSYEVPPVSKLPCLSQKREPRVQVNFTGWPNVPNSKWKTWVKTMHSKYSPLWEKAGISDAIMLSTLKIKRNDAFLFSLVECWCPETNTFVFPWGEATVTLEDVMILGGFSILGDPVLLEFEKDDKFVEIREFLEYGRNRLGNSEKGEFNVDWLYRFMDQGGAYEHEAFLALWLLTYVIPGWDDKVFGIVFDLAVWLGKGRRFALGPCILASFYRDLGILKGAMDASRDDGCVVVTMWSPLYIVQAWAWERFMSLQPKPNHIGSDEARMKRWHGQKKGKGIVSAVGVNSTGLSFLWRPYVIAVDEWSLPKFYVEEELLLRREELSSEFESFFRCLRPCVLVGVDSQEQYNPHRVAMQFGFDQEIPRRIPKEHVSSEIGWYDYNKPMSDDEILYVPPKLFGPDVTVTYSKWWKSIVLCPVSPFKTMPKGRRSCRKPRQYTLSYRKQGHYNKVFQDFVLVSPSNKTKININRCEIGKPNPDNGLDVPPGFEYVDGARIGSLNHRVVEEKSNDATNMFVETAKKGSIDDAPHGFGLSTKSDVGKGKEKSPLEYQPKRNKLVHGNEKPSQEEVPTKVSQYAGYKRTAPTVVMNDIIGSITGEDYITLF